MTHVFCAIKIVHNRNRMNVLAAVVNMVRELDVDIFTSIASCLQLYVLLT